MITPTLDEQLGIPPNMKARADFHFQRKSDGAELGSITYICGEQPFWSAARHDSTDLNLMHCEQGKDLSALIAWVCAAQLPDPTAADPSLRYLFGSLHHVEMESDDGRWLLISGPHGIAHSICWRNDVGTWLCLVHCDAYYCNVRDGRWLIQRVNPPFRRIYADEATAYRKLVRMFQEAQHADQG